MSIKKDSPRTYCQVCGRKMTLSNVFKESSGRISWKFICHYCDTVTQFYDETTEKGEDTMTKENGRTYENVDELIKTLKEIDPGLQVRRSFGYLLSINLFGDTLVTINHPDSNHLDGYWFQWINPTEGNCKTLEIIKSAMGVTNNLLTQFNTYTPEGFFNHDDQDSEDEEVYDF